MQQEVEGDERSSTLKQVMNKAASALKRSQQRPELQTP